MPLSENDRDNITVDSLIGYCQSAFALNGADKASVKRWADCLIDMANALAVKLDSKK